MKKPIIDAQIILNEICKFYRVDENYIFTKSRKRELKDKRQLFHYFCRKYTLLTHVNIGAYSERLIQDHATIIHSIKTISNFIETDKRFAKETEKIEDNILEKHYKNLMDNGGVESTKNYLNIAINKCQTNDQIFTFVKEFLTENKVNGIETNYELISA